MSQEAGRLRWAVQVEAWSPGHAEFELLLSLLPEAERCACTRFRQAQDRKRALVSRLLQRAAAAAALGLRHGGALSVQRTRGNKPYVAGAHRPSHAPNWNYSVSHEVRQAAGGTRLHPLAVPMPWTCCRLTTCPGLTCGLDLPPTPCRATT